MINLTIVYGIFAYFRINQTRSAGPLVSLFFRKDSIVIHLVLSVRVTRCQALGLVLSQWYTLCHG